MSVAKIFDESFYLSNNADVVLAISQGHFASALQHYQLFGGKHELRDPNATFDASYYASQNPDVLTAVSNSLIANVFTHYQMFGEAENRAPTASYAGFDAAGYLAANADVKAAVEAGTIASALDHFIAFGADEGRDGAGITTPTTPGETFTLTKNLDIFSAVGSGTVKGVLAAGDDNSWNVADTVSGGTGSTFDLTAVMDASRSTSGRSTNGIDNFNIVFTDGASDSAHTLTVDASTLAGADTFTLKSATASANDAVSFTDLLASQKVSLQSDDDDLDVNLSYKSGEDSGSADTATVTLDTTDLDTVTVNGAFETVAVAGSGESGIETLNAAGNAMTGLTVTGAGDTTLSKVTGFSTSATVTNIDASGASGAVTIGTVLSNKFTDTKGGTGTSDTLIATNTGDTTISSAFKSTGFETLLFTDDDSGARTNTINLTKSSDITSVGLRGSDTDRDTVTFSNIADKSTIVLQGSKTAGNQTLGNITATVKGATSSEPGSLAVQINNRGKDVGLTGTTENTIKAGTLTANNVEAFDITAADGDVAEFTLAANKLETVTVTASEDFVFSGKVGVSTETTSIDMSGVAGKAQLTLSGDLKKDVDVTTGGGKDVVELGDQGSSDDNTITVSTGEGNDTFTTGEVSDGSVLSVDLGAGDDKVVITDDKDILTTKDHRIDGGEGTDTIEFSGSNATDISTATLANFEKIVISGLGNLSVQAASLNGATTEVTTIGTGRVVAKGTANNDTIDLSKLVLVGPNGVNADGGAGADTITLSDGIDIHVIADATTLTGQLATRDTVTSFTNGTDKIDFNGNTDDITKLTGDKAFGETGSIQTHTTGAALTVNGDARVVAITVETVSSFSTDGASVLNAVKAGENESGTITVNAAKDVVLFLVGDGTNTGLYLGASGDDTDMVASEIALIGTYNGLSVSDFAAGDFI